MNREELLKNAKPILFNTEMVQAILGDRKTVTRRVIKPQPIAGIRKSVFVPSGIEDGHGREIKLLYKVGDILYVRETFKRNMDGYSGIDFGGYIYKADCKVVFKDNYNPWKASIHMPKEAARIFLKVTDIRVERLQDITPNDIDREGTPFGLTIAPYDGFSRLWNELNTKRGYGWEANPWVWVIEFERVEVGNE